MISTPENNRVGFFEKEIIQSVKFRKDLTSKNQMNTNEEDSQAYKIGELVGKFFMYALIGGIIVYCISRKKNKDS
jgi:phosphatidylglycerophosphatase A